MQILTTLIQTRLIGTRYRGIDQTEKTLRSLTGKPFTWYTSAVADGAEPDETEDTEVIRSGFASEDGSLTVHLYYGDVTREINYVDVVETAR